MIQALTTNVYKIEIPLPDMPIKSVNSYLFKSQGRNLLVDAGMDLDDSIRTMEDSLRALDADLGETDFFVTHIHKDHFDLVPRLATGSSRVYLSKTAAGNLEARGTGMALPDPASFSQKSGLPEETLRTAYASFPRVPPVTIERLHFQPLEDGDILTVGKLRFQCIATPGHSRGHMCLYEPDAKLLVSGDHLLHDVSPSIQGRFDGEDPLADYLASLDKVYALNVKLVLPGHRAIFENCRERIDELRQHHRRRNEEIVTLLTEGEKNIDHLAAHLTWSIDAASWEGFSPFQKFLAAGETLSHLNYLEGRGKVIKKLRGGEFEYSMRSLPGALADDPD